MVKEIKYNRLLYKFRIHLINVVVSISRESKNIVMYRYNKIINVYGPFILKSPTKLVIYYNKIRHIDELEYEDVINVIYELFNTSKLEIDVRDKEAKI